MAWTHRSLLALALVSGCNERPPSTAVDYVRAIQDGQGDCQDLADPALAGDCTVQRARDLAKAGEGPAGEALCAAMAPSMWRDECFFVVADGANLVGPEMVSACARTGRFLRECQAHGLERMARPVLDRAVVGQEEATLFALVEVFRPVVGEAMAWDAARDGLIRHVGRRSPDAPFSRVSCGAAPDDICTAAYRTRVRRAAQGEHLAYPEFCATGRGVDDARMAGLPLWEPDVAAPVAAAWQEMCR